MMVVGGGGRWMVGDRWVVVTECDSCESGGVRWMVWDGSRVVGGGGWWRIGGWL